MFSYHQTMEQTDTLRQKFLVFDSADVLTVPQLEKTLHSQNPEGASFIFISCGTVASTFLQDSKHTSN